MTIKTEILKSFYQDSVVLMRVASQVRERPGVREFAALMGTAANHALLSQSGLVTDKSQSATPEDLILTVDATDAELADTALEEARSLLRERWREIKESSEYVPRTLDSALQILPNANLASISVPGAYASFEAMRALYRNLNVFLFSDNVSLEDEVKLKKEAVARGLLCMGPDCGTAYVNGAGLGFFNVVPRGRVGCIAASGTGLQAVASRLADAGEGVSHGIGVGGRDLSLEVGGLMALSALKVLATDRGTEVVIIISKPPHPEVLDKLGTALTELHKPAVLCCLGRFSRLNDRLIQVQTLADAADAALALLRNRDWSPTTFGNPAEIRATLETIPCRDQFHDKRILGVYSGGTLAYETQLILKPLLGDVAFNCDHQDELARHRIIDLGDDAFTVGRPHPMIAPEFRKEFIVETAANCEVAVLILDLVLGRGAHENPASAVAEALQELRSKLPEDALRPVVLASVVGTSRDPQGIDRQLQQLKEEGVHIFPSNAEAARFAALLVKPELVPQLLERRI